MKTQIIQTGIIHKMREIREKVSLEIQEMTLAQEKEFLRKQILELKKKRSSSCQSI